MNLVDSPEKLPVAFRGATVCLLYDNAAQFYGKEQPKHGRISYIYKQIIRRIGGFSNL